jgi:hypothetical protein
MDGAHAAGMAGALERATRRASAGCEVSRRDYVTLAAALRRERPEPEGFADPDRASELAFDVWRACVARVADALKGDNPRFDRDRFYTACGL